MGRTIGAGQAGSVHHQDDGQVLQRDFLENLIVGSLHEGAVDRDDRTQTDLGLPGRKCHCVRFANTDIEEAGWELVTHRFEFVTLAHRSRHDRHAWVVSHLACDCVSRVIGEGGFLAKR